MLSSSARQWGAALAVLVLFMLGGYLIDTIVFRLLRRRAIKTSSKAGMGLARGLHGLPTAIATLLGVHQGLRRLNLSSTNTIDRGVEVLVILLLTFFSARIAGRLIRAYTERDDTRLPSSSIFINLARALIWLIGGLSILAALGISITPLLTALGVGGIAIGLALQSTLENVFSGIQVLASRQIQPGDFIQLESGEQGWVEDVTWRNTTIKMFSNDLIIVPNATIAKSRVINYTTADTQHVISLELGVAYDSDLAEVERVTMDVAKEMQKMPGAVADYLPLFRYSDFGDSAINLSITIRAHNVADRWMLRSEFIKRLHARYEAEGIEIPFPQRTVHMATPVELAENPEPAE